MAKTTKPNGSKRSQSELKKLKVQPNRVKKVKIMDKKSEDFQRSKSEPNVSSSTRKRRATFPQPMLVKVEATENLNEESIEDVPVAVPPAGENVNVSEDTLS